jgi:hypothetical protein
LFEDQGITTLFVTREIHWSRLPTQIAVNALIVHIIATQYISEAPVCNLCHKITSNQSTRRKQCYSTNFGQAFAFVDVVRKEQPL